MIWAMGHWTHPTHWPQACALYVAQGLDLVPHTLHTDRGPVWGTHCIWCPTEPVLANGAGANLDWAVPELGQRTSLVGCHSVPHTGPLCWVQHAWPVQPCMLCAAHASPRAHTTRGMQAGPGAACSTGGLGYKSHAVSQTDSLCSL